MLPWALVAIGGALGAMSRYGVDRVFVGIFGPTVLGTFTVNISGSFLLGLFVVAVDNRLGLSPELRAVIAVGFLGSYTTFSTLTVAGVHLAQGGDWMRAAVNIVGSVIVGILAAFAGIVVGRAFF